MSNKDDLDSIKAEISKSRAELEKLKSPKNEGSAGKNRKLQGFKIIGLTLMLLVVVIGVVLFVLPTLKIGATSNKSNNNFLTPSQLSLLLLGDPLYSYYNSSGSLTYQIHQVGIPNGSVYQFIAKNEELYQSLSGVIVGKTLNYVLYNTTASILYKVVVTEGGCKQYVDEQGGLGNGTDRFAVCKTTTGGYNVTNDNISVTNIGSQLPINYSVYFSNGSVANSATINFWSYETQHGYYVNGTEITSIVNSSFLGPLPEIANVSASLVPIATNDSYTIVQFYFLNGSLDFSRNTIFKCEYPLCTTTYYLYKPSIIENNSILLNSSLFYLFNSSLDSFESPYIYETVQNLTNGASLVNFYSRGLNETVTNNLGEGEISYGIYSSHIAETINNYPSNYTIGYDITSPIANVSLRLGYNVSEAVQYNNGTIIYNPTSAEISEAWYSNSSIVGTIPVYHLIYNNITVKLTKNATYQTKNTAITYSTPNCSLAIDNASFETGIINLDANATPGIVLTCRSETLNISSVGGSLGTGLGINESSISYALMPNENEIQSQINSESTFQYYSSGSFGDQIGIYVLNANGSKETESQVFPVKSTNPTTVFTESRVPSGYALYNWSVSFNDVVSSNKSGEPITIESPGGVSPGFALLGNDIGRGVIVSNISCRSPSFNAIAFENNTVPPFSTWNCTTIIQTVTTANFTQFVTYDGITKKTVNNFGASQATFYTPPGNYSFSIPPSYGNWNDCNASTPSNPSSETLLAGTYFYNISSTGPSCI